MCGNCGAELGYEPNKRALQCPYCGSQTELVRDEPEPSHESDLIVPLAVDKDALHHAVEAYMASGDYTPDDLIDKALITKLEMSYRPAYLFSGDFEAKWTATFEYDRIEHYNVIEERYDSDLKRNVRREVTKTRTVADPRPHSGVASGQYALIGYAGQTINDSSVLSLIEGCSTRSLVDFSDEFLAQIPTEPFTVSADKSFSHRARGRLDELIERSVKEHAQGDRQKDWIWNPKTSRREHSLFVPVCYAQFEYNDSIYDFWTDGTGAGRRVGDPLPVDKGKKSRVRRGFIPLIILSVATLILVMASNAHAGLFWPNIATLAIALLYGTLRRSAVMSHSRNVRSASLTKRRAERSSAMNVSEDDQNLFAGSFQTQRRPLLARTGADFITLPVLTILLLLPVIIEGVKVAGTPTQSAPEASQTPAVKPENAMASASQSQPVLIDDKTAIQNTLASDGYVLDGVVTDTPGIDPDSILHVAKVSCVSAEQPCEKLFVFAGPQAVWSETLDSAEASSSITGTGPGAFSTQSTQQLPDGSSSITAVQYKWDGTNMSRVAEPLASAQSGSNGTEMQMNGTASVSQVRDPEKQGNEQSGPTGSTQPPTASNTPAPIVRQSPTYSLPSGSGGQSYDDLVQAARSAFQRNDLGEAYRLAMQARTLVPSSLPALEVIQVVSSEGTDPNRAEAAALDLIRHGGRAVFRLQHYHAWPVSLHPARLVVTSTSLEYIPDAPCKYSDFKMPVGSIKSVELSASLSHVNLVNIKFDNSHEEKGREAKGEISFAESATRLETRPNGYYGQPVQRPSWQGNSLLIAIRDTVLQLQKQP
jgi:hypothetical protein